MLSSPPRPFESSVYPEQVTWSGLEARRSRHPDAPALQPEVGLHSLKTTLSKPSRGSPVDLLKWQEDFAERPDLVEKVLDEDTALVTLAYCPDYGAKRIAFHPRVQNPVTGPCFIADDSMAPSVRYRSELSNIVQPGKNVEVRVPLYVHKQTTPCELRNRHRKGCVIKGLSSHPYALWCYRPFFAGPDGCSNPSSCMPSA